MPTILLKPYLLSFKNKLLNRSGRIRFWHRDLMVMVISLILMVAIYFSLSSFLAQLQQSENYLAILPAKLISVSLLTFFLLLVFSNIIASLSFFYHAKDIPLLLSTPISPPRLYFGRLLVAIINSSWVFVLLAIPTVLAYHTAFRLPWSFVLIATLLAIPFLIIPAALGSIIVTLIVNIIPTERLQELLIIISLVAILTVIVIGSHVPVEFASSGTALKDALVSAALLEDPHPTWLPSHWIAELLNSYLVTATTDWPSATLLLAITTAGCLALGYLTFDTMFFRGWTRSFFITTHTQRAHATAFSSRLEWIIIPYSAQFRAMAFKELRMFMRDPTQCVQFLLLLMLTFVYLYNFRALRVVTGISPEAYSWWQTILSLANISLGGCVVSAISTRFVFPSISLEGPAYWVVRSAPLSIKHLIRYKFFIWLLPTTCVAVILLLAGSWSIGVSPLTVYLCGAIAVAMSIGIVGLGIGVGCVYANFDWETPSQVAASFGSLIYMLLSFAVIMITLIPGTLLVTLSTVPGLSKQFAENDYIIAMGCATFLVFFINMLTARWAMHAGRIALERLEA